MPSQCGNTYILNLVLIIILIDNKRQDAAFTALFSCLHSTRFKDVAYAYFVYPNYLSRKEGNVLYNNPRKETRCRHYMGYSFRLAELLFLNTCIIPLTVENIPRPFYASRVTLSGTRNSSLGPPEGSIRWPIARIICQGCCCCCCCCLQLHLCLYRLRFQARCSWHQHCWPVSDTELVGWWLVVRYKWMQFPYTYSVVLW